MLDGKRYYAVLPDENPEIRQRLQSLFDLMAKLETLLRRDIEELRVETPRSERSNNP